MDPLSGEAAPDGARGLEKLFTPSQIEGVYGRRAPLEEVVAGINRALDARRPAAAALLNFPPVMSRDELERCGYLANFPHLSASVHEFHMVEGGRHDCLNERATELVLTPAACYPIYPVVPAYGPIPEAGLLFDTSGFCFRREPSQSLDRLQSFRMREFVIVGTPEKVVEFREYWKEAMQGFVRSLGVEPAVAPANDPFFGRRAPYLAMSQREQALKFELLLPIVSEDSPTAVMSFNYHQDHFGEAYRLKTADGATAHSACFATGIDRLALALFRAHGLDTGAWPGEALGILGLSPKG